MAGKATDMIGFTDSGWTVVGRYHTKIGLHPQWWLECDHCKRRIFRRGDTLRATGIYKCLCMGTGHPLHSRWKQMWQRCYNPNATGYKNYGGKGIKVCQEWNISFEAFRDWSIANGWVEGDMQLDRIDPSKDYEPSNCQYLTGDAHRAKTWRDRRG